MTASIKYLSNTQIDKQQWDDAIQHAHNSLMYASSTVLDHMSPGWDALVLGDYEAVMPLTWRRKLGIRYLCQPAFCQQLGVFSNAPIDVSQLEQFLNEASKNFRLTEIYLNYANTIPLVQPRSNYLLSLNRTLPALESDFKTDLQKNLKRVAKFNLQYSSSNNAAEAISLYRQHYGARLGYRQADWVAFKNLCANLENNNRVIIRKAALPNGELLAICLLLRDQHKLYNIASTTLPNGRTLEANHFLYYELIKEFAGQPVVLDFEGSDLPGVARFYQKFGAQNQPYYFYKSNRLPAILKWLKK